MTTVLVIDDDTRSPRAPHQPQGARLRRARVAPPPKKDSCWSPTTGSTSCCSISVSPISTGSRRSIACARSATSPSSCSPPVIASTTRSKRSTPAPTTTSPSPSTSRSCSPACVRSCAAPRRRRPLPAVLQVVGLEIDLVPQAGAPLDGEVVHLTKTELALLEQLATQPGKLLTHEYLLRQVWGRGYGSEEGNYLPRVRGPAAPQARRRRRQSAAHRHRARHRLPLPRGGGPYPDRVTAAPETRVRQVGIVPHTHWDREWYAPFQRYRVRLVHLLDDLLDAARGATRRSRGSCSTARPRCSTTTSRCAPRPRPGCARSRDAGALQVGPWMILMDEFMVSGETIVRDLQHGIAPRRPRSAATPPCGSATCPTCSGTSRRCRRSCASPGSSTRSCGAACRRAVDQTAFWWGRPTARRCAPSTSTARTRTAATSPTTRSSSSPAPGATSRSSAPRACPGGGMLLMNGTDHQLPQPWLGDVVAEANDDRRTTTGSRSRRWPSTCATSRPTGSPPGTASCARAPAPTCSWAWRRTASTCTSARPHAERALERRAEPLAALLLPPDRYPARAARHRLAPARAQQRARLVVRVQRRRGRRRGAGALPGGAPRRRGAHPRRRAPRSATTVDAPPASTIVVNPTARDRVRAGARFRCPATGPVHLVAPTTAPPCPTQVVRTSQRRGVLHRRRRPEDPLGARDDARPRARRRAIARVEHRDRSTTATAVEFTFHDAAPGEPERRPRGPRRSELLALGEAGATIPIRQRRAPVREVVVATGDGARASAGARTAPSTGEGPADRESRADGRELANEHLTRRGRPRRRHVHDRPPTASPSRGLNRSSTAATAATPTTTRRPTIDTVDRPARVGRRSRSTEPGRSGRGCVVDVARYSLPAARDRRRALVHARSDERVRRRGGDHARAARRRAVRARRTSSSTTACATTGCGRTSRCPRAVDGSDAECAFAVVHRGLTAEGGPHEFGLPTFVSRRFVDCVRTTSVGLALLHDGLLEYEVVRRRRPARARAHAAAGHRLPLAFGAVAASNPAGPLDPLEGPSCRTALALDYAVLPHRGDWHAADAARTWPTTCSCRSNACAAAAGRCATPRATGARSRRRVPRCRRSAATTTGALVLRVVNRTPEPTRAVTSTATATARTAAVVDLAGAALGAVRRPVAAAAVGARSRSGSTALTDLSAGGTGAASSASPRASRRRPRGSRPGAVNVVLRRGLPEQRRALAVPAHRARHGTAAGGRVARRRSADRSHSARPVVEHVDAGVGSCTSAARDRGEELRVGRSRRARARRPTSAVAAVAPARACAAHVR